MQGYTIKSVSEEGTYFLVRDWRKNKALWVKYDKLKQHYLFKTEVGAIKSLKSLLKAMPEYKDDKFSVHFESGTLSYEEPLDI